jgi:hypothetical protein
MHRCIWVEYAIGWITDTSFLFFTSKQKVMSPGNGVPTMAPCHSFQPVSWLRRIMIYTVRWELYWAVHIMLVHVSDYGMLFEVVLFNFSGRR